MMPESTILGTLSMIAITTNNADFSSLTKNRQAELTYISPKKTLTSIYEDLYQRWRDSAAQISSIDF